MQDKCNMKSSSVRVKKFKSQSLTSIFDISRSRDYTRQLNSVNAKTGACVCQRGNNNIINEALQLNITPYVTSEDYHALNRNGSNKSVVRSTSTFFYDLDKIVKRHSYHCIVDTKASNNIVQKCMSEKPNKRFGHNQTDAIVQECVAPARPRLQMKDSLKCNKRKQRKRKSQVDPMLSSEIYLNDNSNTNNVYVKQEDGISQKFWSFGKYKTECTYPMRKEKKNEKKCKNKDLGNGIENPCPCQLFSYACPCTDKKSLTELAKNSKSITVINQFTSTTHFIQKEENTSQNYSMKNSQVNQKFDNKMVNANVTEMSEKYEKIATNEIKPTLQITNAQYQPNITVSNTNIDDISAKFKSKHKAKKIICPYCKKKLDISSPTEDEHRIKSKNSLHQHSCQQNNVNYNVDSEENADVCNHNPPCELVPVCQILPNDNFYTNSKFVENVNMKHNPKMLRITKACRHHPPCTVVPSCQRINVLKNNCEYIPPCLHRPRCVNLPLCVPVSKNIYYEDLFKKQIVDNIDSIDYTTSPRYKCVPGHQHDSINNSINHQFHTTQNTCEYFSEYTPRFILNPKMTCMSTTFSPINMPTQLPCTCCKSNKSCQFDCIDCKCNANKIDKNHSNETVVFIRDVGCQFKNKNFMPKDSLLYSNVSSTSLDYNQTLSNKYYTNYHTLRYEDKYTNPISGADLSTSNFTSSLEIDDHCPSHGRRANIRRSTGFNGNSKAPLITAYATNTDPMFIYRLTSLSDDDGRESSKSVTVENHSRRNTYVVKSRRSFLKGKYKNAFSVRRRRKSRANHGLHPSSK